MRWTWLGLAITVGCSSYGSAGGTAGSGVGGSSSGASAGANNVAGGGSAAGGAGGAPSAGGSPTSTGGAPTSGAGMAGVAGSGSSPTGKQALIWIWLNYKDDLAAVTAHAKSFTHVSPALYNLNYAYQSGTPKMVNANDNYDGLSSLQIAQQIHAAGLKCVPLVYAGAGNNGTDQGIQNVITDNPPGTQNNLITAMVAEAKAKGYDGWNLDWEVAAATTGYAQYGTKLISFLGAFKKALNQEGMQLSLDLGGWYVKQCGGDGLVDLIQMGANVDLAIMEDYAATLGTPDASCPAAPPGPVNCYNSAFTGELDVMCNMPPANVSISVIAPDSSAFASQAFSAVAKYGFAGVALWPGNMAFLGQDNFPAGQSWYSVFSDFLASK